MATQSLSDLKAYAVLANGQQSLSDLKGYVVLANGQQSLSDLKAYVVVAGFQSNVSDIKAYVVLQGATPYPFASPVKPPIRQWLSRQPLITVVPTRRVRPAVLAPAPVVTVPPSGKNPIRAFLSRQPQNIIVVPERVRRYSPFYNNRQTLADTAATSDTLGATDSSPESQTDSAASSDAYGGTTTFVKTLADSAASSDTKTPSKFASASLADSASTQDVYGQPTALVDQIFRQNIVAGVPPVNVSGLHRRVIVSGQPPINFAQVYRKALSLVLPPPGPVPVFPPPPIGFPVKVSPVLDTIIGTTKSLREMRVSQQTYPIWDIEILYEGLKDQTQNETPYAPFSGFTQYQQVLQNWLMMYGQSNVFVFDCPWDNSRENQYISTGDGLTYVFPIVRTWGLGNQATIAPVGQVNQVFGVYVNGTLAPTNTYQVSGNTLTFTSPAGEAYPPASGATVTMTFSFYYLCRFVEDEQDFEEFSKNRWTIPSLKFRASPFLWS